MAAVAIAAAQWVATAVFSAIGGSVGLGVATLGVEAAYAATLVAVTAGEIWAVGEISNLINPPPKIGTGGSPVDWKADPQAPVPYIIGRSGTSGNIVYADVAGDKNKYITYATVLSLGPVKSVGGFKANDVLTQFTSDGGEGAGVGQQTTTLSVGASAGATVIQVASTAGFLKGQSISVGGEAATIRNVYADAGSIQLNNALGSSHGLSASVVGPSTISFYQNRMWWKSSIGPNSASALQWTATGSKDTPANHSGQPSTWGSSSKLSGLAHTLWTLEFDGAKYPSGTPKPIQTVEGVYCYDPRLDSTYFGGSGSCRSNDESTWVYSENPYIHALTWLIGRSANGVRTMGVHAPISAIDLAAYVAGANVADANGWRIGGTIYSTDSKWDVLKAMLIAGAGVPVKRGAMISCVVSTPQTSLDTITKADVVGEVSIPATASRRTRINGVWPRYREEAQGWQIVPTAAPITVSAYVAADGEQRTREVEYSLVQDPNQAAVLARYDIENARELGPITLPCKPRWMGYRPGDCITINEPEYGLNYQKVVILNRNVDPATMITTLTVRSETDGKHAYALGQTGSPPPAPALTTFDPAAVGAPVSTDWTATGGVASSSTGAVPQIAFVGACPDPNIATVIFGYRLNVSMSQVMQFAEINATTTGVAITGLAPATSYIPIIQYRSVKGVPSPATELAAVTTGSVTAGSAASVPWTGVTDPGGTRPDNNATMGAILGVNLRDGSGSIVGASSTPDSNVLVLSDGSGQITGQTTLFAASGGTNAQLRNDGVSAYLLGNAASSTGFSAARPFYWNLSSGIVTIDGTGAGANFGGAIAAASASFTGNHSVSGTQYVGALLTANAGVSSTGIVASGGGVGGLQANDRSASGSAVLYRAAGINRLYDSAFGDVIAYDGSGRVGFGTTAPLAKHHIVGNNSGTVSDLLFSAYDTGNYRNGIGNGFYGGRADLSYMAFHISDGSTTGSVVPMFIFGDGGVHLAPNASFGRVRVRQYYDADVTLTVEQFRDTNSDAGDWYSAFASLASYIQGLTSANGEFVVRVRLKRATYPTSRPITFYVHQGYSLWIEGAGTMNDGTLITAKSGFSGSYLLGVVMGSGGTDCNFKLDNFGLRNLAGASCVTGLKLENINGSFLYNQVERLYINDFQYGIYKHNCRLIRFDNYGIWHQNISNSIGIFCLSDNTGPLGVGGDCEFGPGQIVAGATGGGGGPSNVSNGSVGVLLEVTGTTASANGYRFNGLITENCDLSYRGISNTSSGGAVGDVWFGPGCQCDNDVVAMYDFASLQAGSQIYDIHLDHVYCTGLNTNPSQSGPRFSATQLGDIRDIRLTGIQLANSAQGLYFNKVQRFWMVDSNLYAVANTTAQLAALITVTGCIDGHIDRLTTSTFALGAALAVSVDSASRRINVGTIMGEITRVTNLATINSYDGPVVINPGVAGYQINGAFGFGGTATNVGGNSGAQLDQAFKLVNTGKSAFVWNMSNGLGETDLLINRDGGSNGGLRIYDFSNSAVATKLFDLDGVSGSLALLGGLTATTGSFTSPVSGPSLNFANTTAGVTALRAAGVSGSLLIDYLGAGSNYIDGAATYFRSSAFANYGNFSAVGLNVTGSVVSSGNATFNTANIGNVTTGFYQDATNVAMRNSTSGGTMYFQGPSGTVTWATLTASQFGVTGINVGTGGIASSGSITAASYNFTGGGSVLDTVNVQGVPNTAVKYFLSSTSAWAPSSSGSINGLEVRGDGTHSAMMTFHRPGQYAAYFGLNEATNQLAYGGFSRSEVNSIWVRGQIPTDIWQTGQDGYNRFYFGNALSTYFGTGAGTSGWFWQNSSGVNVAHIDSTGAITAGSFSTGAAVIEVDQPSSSAGAALLLKEAASAYGFTIQNSSGGALGGLNFIRHSGSSTGVSAMLIRRDTGNILIGTTTDDGVNKFQLNGGMTTAAESHFSNSGTFVDPDPGVARALKIGSGGLAVLGGVRSDGGLNMVGGRLTQTMPGNVGDGYVNYNSRTTTYSSGTAGYVNAMQVNLVNIGSTATGPFEWANVAIVNNNATAVGGEHVGFYSQVNKAASGPSLWCFCAEFADTSGVHDPVGSNVGMELGLFIGGGTTENTDANRNRVMLDMVADVKIPGTSPVAHIAYGVRLKGIHGAILDRAFQIGGECIIGLNVANTNITSIASTPSTGIAFTQFTGDIPMAFKTDQFIAFDATVNITTNVVSYARKLAYNAATGLAYYVSGTAQHWVTDGGALGFNNASGHQVGYNVAYGLYFDASNIALRPGSTIYFQSGSGAVTWGTWNSTALNVNFTAVIDNGAGAASSATHSAQFSGGSYAGVRIFPRLGSGYYNALVQANDQAIIFEASGNDTGALVIGPHSGSSRGMRIDGTNGNVTFSGSVTATSYITASDQALKTNIIQMQDATSIIRRMMAVHYDDRETGHPNIGFIANDVMPIAPWVVGVNSMNGWLGVDYGRVSVVNTAAIQEVDRRVLALETLVAEQAEEIAALKAA
jgi:hypothetical protein